MKLLYSTDNQTPENKTPAAGHSVVHTEVITRKVLISLAALALLVAVLAWNTWADSGLSRDGALTLSIFLLAMWAWIFTSLPDVYVAFAASILMVLCGVLDFNTLTQSLGHQIIWLLLASVIISQAITHTGISQRFTGWSLGKAKTVRSLFYTITISLYLTAYLIPSTSGRAALAVPIFTAVAKTLSGQGQIIKAVSLLMPSVILLSAISSYIGAGAHLITDQMLEIAGLESIGFLQWMIWGSGLGLLASLLCCELILRLFLSKGHRQEGTDLHNDLAIGSPISTPEKYVIAILCGVIVLWLTESLHGISVAMTALIGALLVTTPHISGLSLPQALKKVPWTILLFMATTLALGRALINSGAAEWLANSVFRPMQGLGQTGSWFFVIALIAISTAAHLMIQSRSARSAVLVPLVITAAVPLGINPVAAAFISTAAAGFCHTLTSSAKPVALFSQQDKYPVYGSSDLIKLSLWLAPLHAALIFIFAVFIWPWMGLPLFQP